MSRTKSEAETIRRNKSAYSTAYRKKFMALRDGESMAALNAIALRTREEVGKIMLCSQQNVGQIERRAIGKIRRRLQSWYDNLKREKG